MEIDREEVGRHSLLRSLEGRVDVIARRIVGGLTERCRELAVALVAEEIIFVSNPKTAEMAKLLENYFRAVNIALANETALICERLEIAVWEVIAVASSKPYGLKGKDKLYK